MVSAIHDYSFEVKSSKVLRVEAWSTVRVYKNYGGVSVPKIYRNFQFVSYYFMFVFSILYANYTVI